VLTAAARARLRALPARRVLSLTFFADPGDRYAALREALLVEVADRFGGDPPPTSVVAQPPDPPGLALEAAVRAPDGAAVERRAADGVRYTFVRGDGFRELHCAGIRSDAGDPAGAFAQAEAVLRREGLHFGHVVRQWAYVEDIGAGYRAFNDARAEAYARADFPAGYPAATGIGQAAGGVVLDFVAVDGAAVTPLSNPRQADAHRYAADGAAPQFERGKRVVLSGAATILVSGTAAIVGERSVAAGDVVAQTRTTIGNIAAVVGARRLSRLRAYVKRARDLPAVRRLVTDAFGPVPAVYVRADICRPELLVEIEGALVEEA
jgi:enamine deaminase RidA (YjgF/YER057c/UK114 family)